MEHRYEIGRFDPETMKDTGNGKFIVTVEHTTEDRHIFRIYASETATYHTDIAEQLKIREKERVQGGGRISTSPDEIFLDGASSNYNGVHARVAEGLARLIAEERPINVNTKLYGVETREWEVLGFPKEEHEETIERIQNEWNIYWDQKLSNK